MKKYRSSVLRSTIFTREEDTVIEIKKYFNIKNKIHCDVYAKSWVLAYANLQENVVSVLINNKKLELSGKVLIFIPPFSVINWQVNNDSIKWMYFFNFNITEKLERLDCKVINNFDFKLSLVVKKPDSALELIKSIPGAVINLSQEYSVIGSLKNKIDQNFFQREKIKNVFA